MEECNESNLNLTVVIMQVASRGQISFNPKISYKIMLVNGEASKPWESKRKVTLNPKFT